MRSSFVVLTIVVMFMMTCIMTSSAADGQCSRQFTRSRNQCSQRTRSYTSYSASYCPWRRIYYGRRSGTSYRLVSSCSPVTYLDTEYYCCPGYRSDGSTCVDIDECAEGSHECQNDSICVDTDGSYVCECIHGFTGTRCQDYNPLV